MWGNKKPDKPQPADPLLKNAFGETTHMMNSDAISPPAVAADRTTARLGPNLHVKGEISGNEDLHVDGTVEGLIHLDEHKLTVGAAAKLRADVIAGEVIVSGSVKGNVRSKKIEIKKQGSVNGDLTTAQIIVEDGAYFKGSIEIEKSAEMEKEGDKNVFSPRSASTPARPEPKSTEPRSI